MRHSVAILGSGTNSQGAIGARIGAMATGLQDIGWTVQILDFTPSSPSHARSLLDRLPPQISRLVETAGCEGDVMPSIGRWANSAASRINTTIAIVTVPPFSLLTATARSLPSHIPLVVDYRDPWSGRLRPPPLAQATRQVERRALRRASAVTYAGGPELGRLLSHRLDIPSHRILAVPNGFDPADLAGVPSYRTPRERDGNPLDLVFGGYWYGRNGPGILLEALAQVGPEVATLTVIGGISPTNSDAVSTSARRNAAPGKYHQQKRDVQASRPRGRCSNSHRPLQRYRITNPRQDLRLPGRRDTCDRNLPTRLGSSGRPE